MNDDLKKAAKLLRGMEGPIIRTIKGKRFISEKEHAASMLLARAYLAEHPEDPRCEHHVLEGDWCPACNKAHKDAIANPENKT